MSDIDAGALDKRIQLQSATTAEDALGQPIQTWATVATVWANVRHLNGKEFIVAGAEQAQTAASFRIRYRSDVLPGWRIVYRSKNWDIKAVLPGELPNSHIDLPATAL